ncbi:tRNA(Ile)(2)-agmatinylcytidine synthase [Methanohalobium sp.]|uniref:tRNA(Ile)(2)-agmatinylcytidine synthase n=1 Tax=Methanohalobium sp. TaxID=2837493 RepID=UPI0025D76A83|nr:tRNA(Ile)(2)-agmatinylcytidine synthase [Methanohalobium sp.]
MIIGIDDTDSREGMCTTYLGAILIEELTVFGSIRGYPILVRLNPTIPYKTRGNAAIAIQIDTKYPDKVIEHVISKIESLAEMQSEKTNPGVVFLHDREYNKSKAALKDFFYDTVHNVMAIENAKNLISKLGLIAKGYKKERGIIGALAATGAMLDGEWDSTYEYLTYRKKERWGSPRVVDENSIYKSDLDFYPDTWDTVDWENYVIVCVPKSPDPVLYGIRGRDDHTVKSAAEDIKSETVERSAVYKTNQGTDMHLLNVSSIKNVNDMQSYIIQGTVKNHPYTIEGGHTIFTLGDNSGNTIDCAAYEPTKNFRYLVRKLKTGDNITVYGSVKNQTLNIEKIKINRLVPIYETRNPTCPICNKRMKSAGKNQGFRCRKCKTKTKSSVLVEIDRDINTGLYEVPPSARRHLAKPLVRFRSSDYNIFPSR